MEVMRDRADNCVVICSIENFDPMGVHTGDSITVAPVQTLTDKEYQAMRDASFAVIRAIGVETGGSNIQFAVHPKTGRMVVIEMNPRVSRSSALASKATGFPIAKIAAKLAVGYTLDELKNDITRETPACFEPSIDYCVVKIPRFTFEKFPQADPTLTTQMKSVGEAMAIGRTFKEALQKALRSLETGRFGLGADGKDLPPVLADGSPDLRSDRAKAPNPRPRTRLLHPLRPAGRPDRAANSRAFRDRPVVPREHQADRRGGITDCKGRIAESPEGEETGILGPSDRDPHQKHRARDSRRQEGCRYFCQPTGLSIHAPRSLKPTHRTIIRHTETRTRPAPAKKRRS